jgi:adenosine deaminase
MVAGAPGVAVSIDTHRMIREVARCQPRERIRHVCLGRFRWSSEDLRALARNSIDASFANAEIKTKLLDALACW